MYIFLWLECTIWVTFGATSNVRLPCFRYVEANVCCYSLYRKYNEILPQWLSNKSKKFVDHYIEKIGLAKCIPLQNISKVDENTYVVQLSKNSPTYNVRLLNNSKLPFCECEAWRNTMLPFKYVLALFEHIEDISWVRLPSSYRNWPFFNLDAEIISTLQIQENELQIANDGLNQKFQLKELKNQFC